MTQQLLNENQVKAVIGITDWRHLSKEKLMNFVSILPNVDNEDAIKIIEQFPEFSKNSLEMINIMKDLCINALEDDKHSTDQSIIAYKQIISDVYMPILDELSSLVKRDDISAEDRKYFADKMIEVADKAEGVADKIGLKDTEGKEFKGKLLNTFGGVILGTLMIGATILGVKYIDNNGKNFLSK